MWSGFQAKKLNTSREHELATNQTENQAEPVPGPDPDKKIGSKKLNPPQCPFTT